MYKPTAVTKAALEFYRFTDDTGQVIDWKPGQLEIIDSIVNRGMGNKNRVQIIAHTRYGKSLSVAAGVCIRLGMKSDKFAVVAGTTEKAQIIMDDVIMLATNNGILRTQLNISEPLDRLRATRSKSRMMFKSKGEIRVFSAESSRVTETSKALMGFGAPNVIEDEAALINDKLQATVVRMLGDNPYDNFMLKIGNPFERNHFLKTWNSQKYYRIFIDDKRGIKEGRLTQELADEAKEADPLLYGINYECKFPDASMIDSSGWLYLFSDQDIEMATKRELIPTGTRRLGFDVARGGRDYNAIVFRQDNYAKVIKKFQLETSKKGGQDTLITAADEIVNAMRDLSVHPQNVFIDDNGVGGGITDYLTTVKGININPVNFGESASERNRDKYANLRAEVYAADNGVHNWLLHGGKLEAHDDWHEATNIRYRKDFKGRIILEKKEDMRLRGMHSPDVLDALALTFAESSVKVYHGVSNATIVAGGIRPF